MCCIKNNSGIVAAEWFLNSGISGGGTEGASVLFSQPSDTYLVAPSRNTDFEFTTGQPKSMEIWLRADNLSRSLTANQKFITVSNASGDQWQVFLIAMDNTNGSRLRFRINGNAAGTIFFYKQTTLRILRNRDYRVTITYNGGTTPASINIYLNGVLQANTTSTGGTFVTNYSDADLRLNFGRSASAAPDYAAGNQAHVVFYNKELSAAEVLANYNSGTIYDYSTSAAYQSNGLHYFPFQTDLVSDTGITLTNSGTTFGDGMDVTKERLTFRPAVYGSSRYVAFGNLIRINSDLFRIPLRSGTTHLAGGNIVNYSVTPSTFDGSNGVTANETSYVIDDATYDLRGGSMGLVGGKIVVFIARYDQPLDTFIDIFRYESTDGTTGNTFGAGISMPITETRFNFYGKVIQGHLSSQHWIVPFYERDIVDGDYKLWLFQTLDNGADGWSTKTKMYDSDDPGMTLALGEAWVIYLGNTSAGSNTYLSLIRSNNTVGLYQMVSGDGGSTWSAPVITNLQERDESNAAMMLDDNGLLEVYVTDRTGANINSKITMSIGNSVETILANPLGYATPQIIFGAGYPGYVDVENLGGNSRLICFSGTDGEFIIGKGNIR